MLVCLHFLVFLKMKHILLVVLSTRVVPVLYLRMLQVNSFLFSSLKNYAYSCKDQFKLNFFAYSIAHFLRAFQKYLLARLPVVVILCASLFRSEPFVFVDRLGVKACRLPILEFMKRKKSGTYNVMLPINLVVEILAGFALSKQWVLTLSSLLPPRIGYEAHS